MRLPSFYRPVRAGCCQCVSSLGSVSPHLVNGDPPRGRGRRRSDACRSPYATRRRRSAVPAGRHRAGPRRHPRALAWARAPAAQQDNRAVLRSRWPAIRVETDERALLLLAMSAGGVSPAPKGVVPEAEAGHVRGAGDRHHQKGRSPGSVPRACWGCVPLTELFAFPDPVCAYGAAAPFGCGEATRRRKRHAAPEDGKETSRK
jgi:hypothetical protein